MQLWIIAVGYAAVFTISAGLVLLRYLQEITHPKDVIAYGGMYAGGDAILGIFIVCLFMIPTIFSVWVMAKSERFSIPFSQVLLGLALTAPICLALLYFTLHRVPESIITVCLCRLVLSPFILVGMGVSRFAAGFARPKKLTSFALLVEGLTLGIAVALLFKQH